MGLSKPQHLYFETIDGNVKRTGGGLTLANGQVAVIDLTKPPSKNGATLVNNFSGLSRKSRIEFRMGKPQIGVSKSLDNKPWTSLPFTLNDVVELRVDAPKVEGIKVDDMIIGYNGKDGSEIVLEKGDNEVIQLTLDGKAMGYLGYETGVTVQFQLEAPNTGDFTMHEIIEDAVERLKDYELVGQTKLTDYVDIMVVNSENTSTIAGSVNQKYYNLVVRDSGRYSDLGNIQAKYNNVVMRTDFDGDFSTYTIAATALPSAYVKTFADKLKGCADCPTGYDLIEGGFVYSVSIEDDGADLTATMATIPGLVPDSTVKLGNDDGVGTYSLVVEEELTEEEIATFIGTAAGPKLTARFTFIGEVSAVCENTETETINWVAGKVCKAINEKYTITIADDECGNNRLDEIQRAYDDLTITVSSTPAPALCQTTYETTILTNVVCEECDPAFRDLLSSERPKDFHFSSWEKEEKTYSATAKMGIRFRAKPTVLSGSEEYRDDMDFIFESPRLSLVGGYPLNINESYKFGAAGRMTVKILERYAPPKNYGGNLRHLETMSRMYFEGTRRHVGNNFAKYTFGEETRFKGMAQYVDYALTIHKRRYTQGWSDKVDEGRTYHFTVEVGKHQDIESLLNDMAAAAGVPTVQAYGK